MKYLALPLSFFVSYVAFAGCGDSEEKCLIVTRDNVVEKNCSVSACANIESTQIQTDIEGGPTISLNFENNVEKISIDGAVGYSLPSAILQENLSCYTTEKHTPIYCVK